MPCTLHRVQGIGESVTFAMTHDDNPGDTRSPDRIALDAAIENYVEEQVVMAYDIDDPNTHKLDWSKVRDAETLMIEILDRLIP